MTMPKERDSTTVSMDNLSKVINNFSQLIDNVSSDAPTVLDRALFRMKHDSLSFYFKVQEAKEDDHTDVTKLRGMVEQTKELSCKFPDFMEQRELLKTIHESTTDQNTLLVVKRFLDDSEFFMEQIYKDNPNVPPEVMDALYETRSEAKRILGTEE